MQFNLKPLRQVFIYALILALAPLSALAQDLTEGTMPPVDILPARTIADDATLPDDNDSTHPTVHMTPDRSELIRLDREAGTIVVGNPHHLSVLIDTSKTLVLVPKEPGATYFTALDGKGNVIMQRHVIVAAPKEHYVRVRRACASSDDDGCQNTSVYYCPDMCHQVRVAAEESGSKESGAAKQEGMESPSGGYADTDNAADNTAQ